MRVFQNRSAQLSNISINKHLIHHLLHTHINRPSPAKTSQHRPRVAIQSQPLVSARGFDRSRTSINRYHVLAHPTARTLRPLDDYLIAQSRLAATPPPPLTNRTDANFPRKFGPNLLRTIFIHTHPGAGGSEIYALFSALIPIVCIRTAVVPRSRALVRDRKAQQMAARGNNNTNLHPLLSPSRSDPTNGRPGNHSGMFTDIHQTKIHSRNHSTSNRNKLRSLLAARWGIAFLRGSCGGLPQGDAWWDLSERDRY